MNDDDLITLKDASEIVFGGKVSVTTLKAQWRRGNLTLSKIGRSHFAPVSAFKQMVVKCQDDPPAHASGSIKSEAPGLSSTVEAAAARDSLMQKLTELKGSSANTLHQNILSENRRLRLLRMSSQPMQRNTSRTK